jgi:site-specific DNA-adenine methylase
MYGFQNMIRFNNSQKFNTPIGVAGYSDDIKNRILSFKTKLNIKIINHDYKLNFIKKAQNPKKNVYVVGECISTDQGWVEGAIQSVNDLI